MGENGTFMLNSILEISSSMENVGHVSVIDKLLSYYSAQEDLGIYCMEPVMLHISSASMERVN